MFYILFMIVRSFSLVKTCLKLIRNEFDDENPKRFKMSAKIYCEVMKKAKN